MRTVRKAKRRPSRFGTVLCLILTALVLLAGPVPAAAESIRDANIEDMTGETQMILAQAAIAKLIAQGEEELSGLKIRCDGRIRGRGRSDDPSGEEPYYIGLVGYAAVSENQEESIQAERMNLPWQVPAYLRSDDRWFISRLLPHKTPVVVIAQEMKETAPGQYTGRLKIIRLDSNEISWMDVENFIASPYWFYPIRRAVRYGSCIAVYRQASGHRPVTAEGKDVSMKNETRILIPARDAWEQNRDQAAPEYQQLIPGVAFRSSDEGIPVPTVLFFHEEDLSLIY